MSGFLPDLASWALRGGAGDGNNEGNEDSQDANGNEQQQNAAPTEELTEQEVRARRLARMEALQKQQQAQQQQQQQQQLTANQENGATKKNDAAEPMEIEPEPMDVDNKTATDATKANDVVMSTPSSPQPVSEMDLKPAAKTTTDVSRQAPEGSKEPKKRKAKDSQSQSSGDSDKKIQKKKELMLKKILLIRLVGASTSSDSSCVEVDVDDTSITVQSIAEILAVRLSMAADAPELRTMPPQKALIPYLAQSHRRAAEELKSMKQSSKAKSPELLEILDAIKRQTVNYAASCIREPDLFEMGSDARLQLAKCLVSAATDLNTSITFGVMGTSSSFYYCLCEELLVTDKEILPTVVADVVAYITKSLSKFESVLDGDGTDGTALAMVSALTSVCLHKKAAEAVLNLPNFLLPAPDSAEAKEVIRPPGADILRMLTGENRPYLRRSGPALDKETILGLVLRLGIPKNNPSFSPTSILRQSLDTVERINSQQRQQLRVHQDASSQLILALVKAGPGGPARVMRWFVDALLVNIGASALRPDPSKVSSSSTLLNASVALLKLCEPFVGNEKKHHLIDPNFVSSSEAHLDVYTTEGDDAVPRLGENAASTSKEYNPKNKFIPQCFFFAARFVHLGIVPLLSYHENLLRHISHAHWELTSQNRDVQSDPHFSILVSKQRTNEVALFQEELVSDTLRFCNLMGKILFEMDDDMLRLMPEHFVDNTCDVLMSVAKMKPRLLRDLEFRYVFKLVVKLLSPKYTSIVRNYNLRAMLGDVLYELYLPSSSDDRRDVPASVATDRLAGGQVYLLSDQAAQETLAPSLLLLYGEVEHTGYYDKMSHRAKIASLIKYLWESSEHRPAFRRITQNKESFIKFANGIMNETNTLIATVMQKLPEIREAQMKMKNTQEWGRLTDDERNVITGRLDDNEREVKHALPLCNKTLQMFGYLNTDRDIRSLFLLEELCTRLVTMLLHVLTKLVGSKGLDLKVDNPEQYDFRPKEMLRDLCAIFALFASANEFQIECAKSGCDPELLGSAVKTCRRLNLLVGESMNAFESLPALVEKESKNVAQNEALLQDAPEEFKDEILDTFMKDPVILPSGHFVDRSTITQHLLNDPIDPFNRVPMTIDDIKPATELKERMTKWLEGKRAAQNAADK